MGRCRAAPLPSIRSGANGWRQRENEREGGRERETEGKQGMREANSGILATKRDESSHL